MSALLTARVRRARTALLLLATLIAAPPAAAAETLMDIVRLAEQRNPDYRAVQAARDAVEQNRVQARAQALLPSISANAQADYNYQDFDAAFRSGDTSFIGRSYAINLRQPVFRRDLWIALQQGDERVQQAELDVAAGYQDLLLLSAERYFAVLAAQDDVAFARAELEALQRQLDQARQRFEVGLIAITDVLEAQSGYDLAVAQEIGARNALDNALEALREVTGSYAESLAPLGGDMPLVSPDPEDIDSWTQTALEQNLRLSSARAGLSVARREIERQRAGHLPTLELVGSQSYQYSAGIIGDSETNASRIGLELNLPLYEGGQINARTREAVYRHQEALDRLEAQQRAVQRETNDAYLGVVVGISRVKALEQAVVSTQTAVEATVAGFEVGTRTGVDVVDSERRLAQARADLAQARYTYVVDTLRLKLAAGTLSPADIEQVENWLEP